MSSSDLKNNTTSAGSNLASPSPAAQAIDDPLAHLHKMSTTAGLGSGDYVAVNGTAVFAIILGVASAFAFMDRVFLVIPLAGIVASIVAWRQISQSNGTQTGRTLAIIAALLSLGMGGAVFARQIAESIRNREDRAAIQKLVLDLGEQIKAGNVDGAYAMYTERFRGVFPIETFRTTATALRDHPILGKLKGTTWNGLVEFQKDDATGAEFAVTAMQFDFEKSPNGFRESPVLRKINGQWQIDQMNELFPPARK